MDESVETLQNIEIDPLCITSNIVKKLTFALDIDGHEIISALITMALSNTVDQAKHDLLNLINIGD